MGVIGCGMLKIFLPFIIVFPGLVAFAKFGPGLPNDAVYVQMIHTFLPPLGQGIMLAVLIAAIMSTVSSVLNSSSTIWSIDVHRRILRPRASEGELVKVGRWSTFAIIVIGTALAPLLLWYEKGIFIYIQDMAALFAPPISVIFLAAFLWRGAHGRAATFTLVFGIVVGALLWTITETCTAERLARRMPSLSEETLRQAVTVVGSIKPLLNRAAISWVLCLAGLITSTWAIRRNPREKFDADTIWNPRWARLPEGERPLNRGLRNLMFWWLVMVTASTSLFIIFR
jgi:SSS family solute:Na+ symporter